MKLLVFGARGSRFVYSMVLVIIVVIAYMPLHAFVSTWGGALIEPMLAWKAWKDVVIAFLAVMLAAWLTLRRRLMEVLSDKLVIVACLYLAFVSLLGLLGRSDAEARLAGMVMDARYVLVFLIIYVGIRQLVAGINRSLALNWLALVGVMLSMIGLLQVYVLPVMFLAGFGYGDGSIAPYTTVDDNPNVLRAFATLRGPNDYGAFLVMCLVAGLALRRWRLRYGVVAAVSVGIYFSYSRSAWLGAVVAVLAWFAVRYGRSFFRKKFVVVALPVAMALVVAISTAAAYSPTLRLLVFHSSPGDPSLVEGSTEAHIGATSASLQRIAANPLGCGPGCSGPASYYGDHPMVSESHYLQIAEELGVIGLALWLAMFGAVMWRLYQARADVLARVVLASGMGLSVIALFLHTWNDDPLSLTWWALAALALSQTNMEYLPKKRYN